MLGIDKHEKRWNSLFAHCMYVRKPILYCSFAWYALYQGECPFNRLLAKVSNRELRCVSCVCLLQCIN